MLLWHFFANVKNSPRNKVSSIRATTIPANKAFRMSLIPKLASLLRTLISKIRIEAITIDKIARPTANPLENCLLALSLGVLWPIFLRLNPKYLKQGSMPRTSSSKAERVTQLSNLYVSLPNRWKRMGAIMAAKADAVKK